MRSLQELAREACTVQNACNLSGVAHGFARAMSDLREHVTSTDELREHPIARAWADKIAALTGIQWATGEAIAAHVCCELIAGGKDVPKDSGSPTPMDGAV